MRLRPDGFAIKYTGQYRDTETGLDYFNARYYSPAQGRFVSPDPGNAGANPGDPATWNGYAYVGGNPVNVTDPSGEGFWSDLGGFFAGIFGSGSFGSLGLNDGPWNEKVPGQSSVGSLGGALNTGSVFGQGQTGPFVFSFADAVGGKFDSQHPTGLGLVQMWIRGLLPPRTYYSGNTKGSQDLRRTWMMERFKNNYVANGCPNIWPIDTEHGAPFRESLIHYAFLGNLHQFVVGGFNGDITKSSDGSMITTTVKNTTGISSLTGRSTWYQWPLVNKLKLSPDGWDNTKGGPMSNNTQVYNWTEANPCNR